MFSNVTVGLIFAIGFAAWVYAKIQKQTGGNTKTSLIVAFCAALVAFLAIITVLGLIFPN